ncbi:uncharacterized protein DS421_19g646540 [Arachis hypogaea]|uniref:Uncharacterized protein n=1 Tax=Arachis hypogaea TaxID=3818 RepID=A0A6B9V606_ARAHY|nr:uncharacterized protein DS421_19g646540 [Arachis hypogaea]
MPSSYSKKKITGPGAGKREKKKNKVHLLQSPNSFSTRAGTGKHEKKINKVHLLQSPNSYSTRPSTLASYLKAFRSTISWTVRLTS